MQSTEAFRRFYAEVDWSHTDFTERHPELADWALHLLGGLPGPRVLDLGCGSGTLAVELAERGLAVTGVDLVIEHAAKRCSARGVEIELIEADMRDLDVVDTYDAVINWDVSGIGLFGEAGDRDVLQRIQNALAPGGKLLLQTYNMRYAQDHETEGLVWDACSQQLRGCIRGELIAFRLYSPSEWSSMLEACGLHPCLQSPADSDQLMSREKMLCVVAEKASAGSMRSESTV